MLYQSSLVDATPKRLHVIYLNNWCRVSSICIHKEYLTEILSHRIYWLPKRIKFTSWTSMLVTKNQRIKKLCPWWLRLVQLPFQLLKFLLLYNIMKKLIFGRLESYFTWCFQDVNLFIQKLSAVWFS